MDVFPADRVPDNALARKLQFLDFSLMLLYNRGYSSGSGGFVGITERILLWLVPRKRYIALSQFFARRGRRWNSHPGGRVIFPVTIRDCKRYYPADLYDHLAKIAFHGSSYSAYGSPDCFLHIRYGDFMRLPPKEDQVWKHPPLLVDYTHNYEELSVEDRYPG